MKDVEVIIFRQGQPPTLIERSLSYSDIDEGDYTYEVKSCVWYVIRANNDANSLIKVSAHRLAPSYIESVPYEYRAQALLLT
jgi:hypothetical protein